ncbi:MAG: hypothetical protein FWB96_09345 [Defluviitaleaceae bacterium]|nr:hypothetical protein [Defluviitaleaceae bacterium]MCL2263032.1 hypothetical protein [Defluviitaleaceae bacterium]
MNFKRLIAITAVAGMLAVTGCSSNTPNRNQGNRNGQRVADAVNNRPDSYTNDRVETSRGLFGRTTRGMNSNANSRYTRTNNRATTFARPHHRAGSTFHRGPVRNQAHAITNTDTVANNAYNMNHTERGIPANGMNRAARRGETINRTNRANRTNNVNRNADRNNAVNHNVDHIGIANHNADHTNRVNHNVGRTNTANHNANRNNNVTPSALCNDGICLAPTANQTVPTFFNKTKTAPEQTAPQQAPAPTTNPAS